MQGFQSGKTYCIKNETSRGRNTGLIKVILGSPRQLQERWLSDYRQGALAGPTMVPNETLAQFLYGLLKAMVPQMRQMPRIESLWDFARSLLPQGAKIAPIGMEKALASLLARDLHQELPHQVPGIYLNIIRHVLELRRRQIVLPSFDGIPWPLILRWLEDIWPESLYDEFRVYQYASQAPLVTGDMASLAIYGYVEAHESQWQLLHALSHHYSIIVYTPWLTHYDNSLAEDWIKKWREQGAIVEMLPENAKKPRQSAISVRPGTLMLHSIIDQVASRQGENLLLVLGGMDSTSLMRLAKRRGVIFREKDPVLSQAKNVWAAFWRLVQNQGDEATKRLWLEVIEEHGRSASDALGYVHRFSEQLRQIHLWQELVELVDDAARFHDIDDLSRTLTACRDWVIYDQWHIPPRVDLIEELWELLPFKKSYGGRSGILWAEGLNARMLTAKTIIVAAIHEGTFPRGVVLDSLWIPELAQLYGLPGPDHAHQQDLHLLHVLIESAEQEICWVVPQYDDEKLWWPEGLAPEEEFDGPDQVPISSATRNMAKIRDWYVSHYDSEVLDAYQGMIGQELAEALWPHEVTPTALEQYGTCPLAFFYEQVLGLKSPWDEDLYTISPSVKGQWMHKVLELAVKSDQPITAQRLRQFVEEIAARIPPKNKVLQAVLSHVKDDVVRDLLQVWPLIAPSSSDIVDTEYPLQWTLYTEAGSWQVKGRLDRVDYAKDGTITITDYKTGILKNPDKIAANNLQLPLYYEGMRHHVSEGAIVAQVQGISAKNQFVRRLLSLDGAQDDTALQLVNQIASRVKQGEFFPLPRLQDDPCRICAYVQLCSADIKGIRRRKKAPDDEYWQLWED